jgi:hypothetical protein
MLGALARITADGIRPYRLDLQRVPIAPWQGALDRARDDYLDHLDAWEDFWRAVAEDPQFFADTTLRDRINDTFKDAGDSMSASVPWPDVFGYGERVDDAFRD